MLDLFKFISSEKRKNPAYAIKHMQHNRISCKESDSFPNFFTNFDNTSGEMGSFFFTVWLTDLIAPSFTELTRVESHGFLKSPRE